MAEDAYHQKLRLSEPQKKQNHISSEKQRRSAIRAGFDELSNMVPGMKGKGSSEAKVLEATVAYMKTQLDEKQALRKQALALGMSEGDFEHIYREEERSVSQEARPSNPNEGLK